MPSIRAKLHAFKRLRKGKPYWTARGSVPVRLPDGTIARRRIERGISGNTSAARQVEIDRLSKAYEEATQHEHLTFARAYLNYIQAGHPVPLYAEKILGDLGVRQAAAIDDTVLVELAGKLFAKGARPSYVNRHLYTPVSAVLRMALRERAPMLTRPRGHKEVAPIEIPDAGWFKRALPHMGPDTRALVALLTVHGRRLGDALGRRPADFDADAGTLFVGRTKTGEPLLIDLQPHVFELMRAMPDWHSRRWLFRDGPTAASNVRKDIQVACKAAGVPYFSPHEIGRHSFATQMLRAGYSMQYVKDAGGWATIEMVSKRYGHLERKEVTAAVHQVGAAFLGDMDVDSPKSGEKVGTRLPANRAIIQRNKG
jgi:integrase